MVERIEDLNLPNTAVTRLIKESIPPEVKISNDCRTALARATSVFVLYLTSAATTVAKDTQKNHKSLMADHVLKGLEEIEFESFIQPLKDELEAYRKMIKTKKDKKAAKAETNTTVEGAVIDLENMNSE